VSGVAADAMLGQRVEAGRRSHALASEGCLSRTPQQNIDVLQRFLIERLAGSGPPRSSHGARRNSAKARLFRVADVAAECGVSERQLNRMMRTWIGYGAKRFGRVVRFQEALKEMEHEPALSGAALASETGYFDQAHLTLDMTRLAGDTPGHVASRSVADFYKTRCDGPL
jgi:AraC-like DNA-binding protein